MRGGKREGAGRKALHGPSTARSVRLPDALWEALRRRAEAAGRDVTAEVRETLLRALSEA